MVAQVNTRKVISLSSLFTRKLRDITKTDRSSGFSGFLCLPIPLSAKQWRGKKAYYPAQQGRNYGCGDSY